MPASEYSRHLKKAAAKRARALAMKNQGKTNAEIGKALGISPQRVSQIVAAERKRISAQEAQQ